MSAAAVEHPCDDGPEPLLVTAGSLTERLPGYRVEIIGGVITVAPPQDGPHADALTTLMIPFLAAGLHGKETRILQGVGLWLPGGPEDFAIPDFSVVDADYSTHLVEYSCYDPAVFRLVLEVTSSNYRNDLRNKAAAYAEAKVPVYVIVDRRHGRVHVLTEPTGCGYDSHEVHSPGQTVTLPGSVGAEVTLDVAELVEAGRPRG
ncbi:Uma2 family endonuclease [Streptomyces nitrosporeus]|uniref:Uma2 family endonuclease n=1 Tax=Streptomyces nitrosporeus TaxID=28894 RepID=A0A5J6F958_9ACTN|nr:Uma2 family endonuclease [Streptomyces nitrosporeus]QEU73039.1 Uma2 family endonuclease [Streptomyces nitrosporeus]GGZ17731.1 membrane protein [Streptomyces nitrosporeus]